jgi:dynein heavy chain
MTITLLNESRCEEFKTQYAKYDYLWRKDLNTALKEFLDEQVRGCC